MAKKHSNKTTRQKPLFTKIIVCLLIVAFISTFIIAAIADMNG